MEEEESKESEERFIKSHSIRALIDILHQVHCDNSKQQYYAERPRRHRVSIMPLTPFVFEFFLFNSLYQVDWTTSLRKGELIFHPEDYSESKQQAEFIKFIRSHVREKPVDFYRAFEPLSYLPKTIGSWTKVTPDARISLSYGESFFKKICDLQTILENCIVPAEMPTSKKVFELIDDCRYYIYLVRNNIFHGSKTLGEVYETNQKRRIEIYDLFLKGLTSLFFLSVGKTSVASDFVSFPISSQSLSISEDREVLDQNGIWDAINRNTMKLGDSRLISQFTRIIVPSRITPKEKSALFYPSAGTDLMSPILLGLPYCTQFYFFERNQIRYPPNLVPVLRQIPGLRMLDDQPPLRWKQEDRKHFLDFEFNGTRRRVNWVHSDNKEFLRLDVELSFYFHRGDSWGEGGSGQQWDSELLPELLKMIPDGSYCFYLTDGEPGGIDEKYFEDKYELNMPFFERGRKYYCGKLFAVSKQIA